MASMYIAVVKIIVFSKNMESATHLVQYGCNMNIKTTKFRRSDVITLIDVRNNTPHSHMISKYRQHKFRLGYLFSNLNNNFVYNATTLKGAS